MDEVPKLNLFKRSILGAICMLVLAGVYVALYNLPIVSGCAFYGECEQVSDRSPGNMGRSVP